MLSAFLVGTSLTLFPIIQLPDWKYSEITLATHEISLSNRQSGNYVNGVFRDNILLNIDYLSGVVQPPSLMNWDKVRQPRIVEFKLNPNETFAFHDDVLSEYRGSVSKTTNAHFNSSEGFKSDGYLVGDGVCHLASLINWTAKDAGLSSYAPTNHNFANIPEIPREYGTSIYYYPGRTYANQKQNLYVTNNYPQTITFKFEYKGDKLRVSISES